MSTVELSASSRSRFTASARSRVADRAWRLTAAAGVLQLGGLAIVLAGGSLELLAALVAAAGIILGGYVLAPRAAALAGRYRGLIVFLGALFGGAAWFTIALVQSTAADNAPTFYGQKGPGLLPLGYGGPPSSIVQLGRVPVLLLTMVAAAAAGLVLNADAVRIWLGFAPHQRAPWKEMTDTQARSGGIASRAILGVLLVGYAAFVGIFVVGPSAAYHPGLQLLALVIVAAAAAMLIGLPVAIGSLMRVDRDKAGSARERERQRFAAHLHDSVLQTLALVQRQAHDPVAVARLARRQEHALRAWMAGEAELLSETLVAGLRDAVATVEDEHGITIELTAIGDRSLDSAGEELIAAAREALRNAARYGGGAPVFVFAEITATGVGIFVRDEGPGFDPESVPAERRGIRDAIVGRMASAGGSATIESAPGEGTEVALRICPGRKAGR